MRSLYPVVQALVRTMIGTRCKAPDRLDIAAQLFGDHDTRPAETGNQPCQTAPCGPGIPLWLYEDVKHIPVRVDRPPEPVFPAAYRDGHFIEMPFVDRTGPASPDAIGKMVAKAFRLLQDCFPTDQHATFGEEILDIRSAEFKAMVDPDSIGDDLARETKTLQARHLGRHLHAWGVTSSVRANKLAITFNSSACEFC